MAEASTIAVIGASRGIGLELVRQYAAAGWRVHATTRTPQAPGELAGIPGEIVVHGLDVTDPPGIEALAAALGETALDVLVHNAGVSGRGTGGDETMRVNAEAPIALSEALLGHVARSRERKLLLMTSQLGARRGRRGSLGTYGDSKAALNDRFREREPGWRARGVTAVVMHPGWVRTDMGGRSAPLSVGESVRGVRRVLAGLTPADAGRFLTWEGREHPW